MLERWIGWLLVTLLGLFMAGGTLRLAGLGGLAGRGADLTLLLVALVALYGAALFIVRRQRSAAPPILLILALGLLIRAPLFVAPPRLSDDIYRYVWDGRVAAAGLNPFRHAPADTALAHLRDPDWALINNPKLVTIYPPVAQALFRLGAAIAPGVTGLKLLLGVVEFLLALVLAGGVARAASDRWKLLLVWWHPLLLVEGAWSGHADSLGMLLLVAAFLLAGRDGGRNAALAGVLSGLALLVKFLVAPLLPLLAAPRRWAILAPVALATVGLCYLPYLAPDVNVLGSLGTYAAKWRSNDCVFAALLRPGTLVDQDLRLIEAKQRAIGLLALLFVGVAAWRPTRAGAVLALLGGSLLLSPVIHPWYVAWLVPFLAFGWSWTWFVFSLTVLLAYHPLPGFLSGQPWRESTLVKAMEFAPVSALALVELRRAWRRRSQTPPEDRLWSH